MAPVMSSLFWEQFIFDKLNISQRISCSNGCRTDRFCVSNLDKKEPPSLEQRFKIEYFQYLELEFSGLKSVCTISSVCTVSSICTVSKSRCLCVSISRENRLFTSMVTVITGYGGEDGERCDIRRVPVIGRGREGTDYIQA